MIARVWKGIAKPGLADDYVAHLQKNVVPELEAIPGFRGVELLRDREGKVIVITKWESMDAIGRFAGSDPGVAVVAPEAQRVLASWDTHAEHFEIALDRVQRSDPEP